MSSWASIYMWSLQLCKMIQFAVRSISRHQFTSMSAKQKILFLYIARLILDPNLIHWLIIINSYVSSGPFTLRFSTVICWKMYMYFGRCPVSKAPLTGRNLYCATWCVQCYGWVIFLLNAASAKHAYFFSSMMTWILNQSIKTALVNNINIDAVLIWSKI